MEFISFVDLSLGAGLFLLAEGLSAALHFFLVLVMRRSPAGGDDAPTMIMERKH